MATTKKNVVEQLSEEKAKRDASYEYDKKSPEQAAEGGFKGALASGLASRFIPATKKGGGSNWKAHAATLAAGTAAGALAGKKYNDTKVDKAEKARTWLGNKKKAKEYAEKNKEIYKKADEAAPKPGLSGKDVATDVGAQAVAGAGLGALLGKKYRLLNAKRAALIGGSAAAAEDGLYSAAGDQKGLGGQMAAAGIAGAAGGAVEPGLNRVFGRVTKNKDYVKQSKNADVSLGHSTKGKSVKSMTGGLAGKSLRNAGKWGAIGAASAYGLSKLTDYLANKNNSQLKKESGITFSAQDAVEAETAKANESLRQSRVGSIVRKAGLAGLGYIVGNKIGGHGAGKAVAGMTLAYSVPKFIHEESNRSAAKKFKRKNSRQKLLHVKEQMDADKFGTTDIAGAYTMVKGIDHLYDTTIGRKHTSSGTAKEKFSLSSEL